MTTPTLLPSLPPEGELGQARVRPSLPDEILTPTLLPSLPPEGELG